MPLPDKPLKLSEAIDHGHNGKEVKFFCYGTGKYEHEKHLHDHEDYMRRCDADLIRLLLTFYYKEAKRLAESGKFKNVNAPDAVSVLNNCMAALSANGNPAYEPFKHFKPYSRELLSICSSYLRLALQQLDPQPVPTADHSLTRTYKQLLHLAVQAERRYEVVEYSDLKQ